MWFCWTRLEKQQSLKKKKKPRCLTPMFIWSFIPITLETNCCFWVQIYVFNLSDELIMYDNVQSFQTLQASFWKQASDANLTDISSMKDVKSYFAIVSEFFIISDQIELYSLKWLFFPLMREKSFILFTVWMVVVFFFFFFFKSVYCSFLCFGGRIWTVNVFESLDIVWKKPRV